MNETHLNFDAAVKRMPRALQGSFDPLTHKTVSDLARLAAHELDLYTESEECDIRNSGEAKTVHAYLVKLVAAVSA